MRVTICEFGPRDGEITEIPDGRTMWRFPIRTGSLKFSDYTVQEYRHPEQHETRFALVSPEFLKKTLGC